MRRLINNWAAASRLVVPFRQTRPHVAPLLLARLLEVVVWPLTVGVAHSMDCEAGIRKLVTHRGRRASEQTGVEILASLGVLARWIDEARVEEA